MSSPSSPFHLNGEYTSVISSLQSAHYLEIACFTLMLYDLLTTFGEEVCNILLLIDNYSFQTHFHLRSNTSGRGHGACPVFCFSWSALYHSPSKGNFYLIKVVQNRYLPFVVMM